VRLYDLFVAGGICMIPLAACSVAVVAIIIWRCIANARVAMDADSFLREVEEEIRLQGWEVALAVCRRTPKPIGSVFATAIILRERDSAALVESVQDSAVKHSQPLEWGLNTLGTIATIAPFIGLLGTVLGVLRAFWNIGLQGKTGAAVVASGVAEALITTVAGLSIAIVAVLAYNALLGWYSRYVENLQLAGAEMARCVKSLLLRSQGEDRREAVL